MQFAEVSTRETISEIMVFCAFIPGSDAQGCAVELTGHIDNITMNLTLESESSEAITLYELPHPLYCYHQAHAFDIEADGSVGTLPVLVVLPYNNTSMISHCIMTTVNPEGPSMYMIGVISAVAVLMIIISIVIIIIILLHKHSRKQGESRIIILIIIK